MASIKELALELGINVDDADLTALIAKLKTLNTQFEKIKPPRALNGFKNFLNKTFDKKKIDNFQRSVNSAGQSLSLMVTLPLVALGKRAFDTYNDFEDATLAFKGLLGTQEKALNFDKSLAGFAKKTPFELQELRQLSVGLLGVGFSTEQVIPLLTRFGDIAGGLGNKRSLDMLLYTYKQVKSAGKLQGNDILSFNNAAVPIMPELADIVSKRKGSRGKKVEVKDLVGNIAKYKITFEEVEQAFGRLGTKYKGMMDNLAQGNRGMLSNVNDTIDSLFIRSIGLADSKIKSWIKSVQEYLNKTEKIDDATLKLILKVAAAIAATGPALIGLAILIKSIMVVFGFLQGVLSAFGVGLKGILVVGGFLAPIFAKVAVSIWGMAVAGWAAISPWIIIPVLIGLLFYAFYKLYQYLKNNDMLPDWVVSLVSYLEEAAGLMAEIFGFTAKEGPEISNKKAVSESLNQQSFAGYQQSVLGTPQDYYSPKPMAGLSGGSGGGSGSIQNIQNNDAKLSQNIVFNVKTEDSEALAAKVKALVSQGMQTTMSTALRNISTSEAK